MLTPLFNLDKALEATQVVIAMRESCGNASTFGRRTGTFEAVAEH
jgi:hypothetical protein